MKSKLRGTACEPKIPYVAVTRRGPKIVLFVTKDSGEALHGAVVYAEDESWLGDNSTIWNKDSFTLFTGTIEISN